MAYESVGEILDSIDETRKRLLARAESLDAALCAKRPSPAAWSVAEIVEHLSISEDGMMKLIGMMLAKAETAGGHAKEPGRRFEPVSIDRFTERSLKEKYEAPEFIRPHGGVSLADSIAKMQQMRATLHGMRPRLEAADLTEARYPHPMFGPLNAYQWLLFIGAHEERHLRQIEAILSEAR
jgi:hypothetical protein